jgi:hypothetical protein
VLRAGEDAAAGAGLGAGVNPVLAVAVVVLAWRSVRHGAQLRRLNAVTGAWRVAEPEFGSPVTWLTDDEVAHLIDNWKGAA